MRGATRLSLQLHQTLRLPRKMKSHDWSASQMKRCLHCAEQQVSLPNLTKYCACHAKWFSKISNNFRQNRWNIIYNARPIRDRSDHDLTMIRPYDPRIIRPWNRQSATRLATEVTYFSRPPRAFCIEKYNILRSGYPSKFHRILHLPRKVRLQLHQILRLPRKVNVMINSLHTWNVIYNARSNKCHCPNSRKTALATKNDSHDWSLSHMTYEMSFTMRKATGVIVQPHQILRLPRKVIPMTDPCHIWNVIYNARSNRCHGPTSPKTAPATKNDRPKCERNLMKTDETSFTMRGRSENDPRIIRPWNRQSATRLATEVTFHDQHEHFVFKNTTFCAPAILPNFTEYCACHEKWHCNFTEYRACYEKWHLNFTKYCTCHEKWHVNFTKYCTCHEKWYLNFTKYCTCHEKWHLNFKKILRLPRKVTWLFYYVMTLLLLDSTTTELSSSVTWLYLTLLLLHSSITWLYYYLTPLLPVVPHKAVAEVSRIGNYRRDWLLWVTDGRAKTLMDQIVQLCSWLTD